MADSPVQICNAALIKLGAERINSLTENNKRARLCNERYNSIRKEVLRAHPWNFAIRRTSLSKITGAPAYEYKHQYQLPNDCLRVLETDPDRTNPSGDIMGNSTTKYKIEGRLLLTDAVDTTAGFCSNSCFGDETTCVNEGYTWTPEVTGVLNIRYIVDLEDTTQFDPNFDEAFAARLASEFAYPLVQSNTISRTMDGLYREAIRAAKTQDGQEGSPDDLQADFFVNSRF